MSIMMANTFDINFLVTASCFLPEDNIVTTSSQLYYICNCSTYFNDDSEDSSVCGEWDLASTNIMWKRCLHMYR